MAELRELFEQYPRPSVKFLSVLMQVGTVSTLLSVFPVLHVVQLSLDEIGAGVFWLRLWLLCMLTLQLCQLPHRVLLQRQVVLISLGNQEDVANKLTALVHSRRWLAVKYIGYVVYACFTAGVVLSYYFSSPQSSPDYLRSTVMIVCLAVVIRMIFSFAWFFYMFMYTDELPFLPNPRGVTEDMLQYITRFRWSGSNPGASLQYGTVVHEDGQQTRVPLDVAESLQTRFNRHGMFTWSLPNTPRPEAVAKHRHVRTRDESSASIEEEDSNPCEVPPENEPSPDSCPICLVEYEHDDDMAQLSCHPSHVFHYDCLRLWLRQSTACPMCSQDIADGTVTQWRD